MMTHDLPVYTGELRKIHDNVTRRAIVTYANEAMADCYLPATLRVIRITAYACSKSWAISSGLGY